MVVNSLILITLSAWILRPSADSGHADPNAPRADHNAEEQVLPTKADLLALTGVRFGLSAPQVPWSTQEIDRLANTAGTRPTILQYFVKWSQAFRPEAVQMSYAQGAMPVLSWEPWSGMEAGLDQPDFALAKIINGSYDAYIRTFASAVRDQPWPIAIRFAHEMNGHWYPWSERRSGNRAGEYAKAWRHVHDLFTAVGALNVIWIWSPNILRPVPKVSLKTLYPGDAYVDWVGIVGYATKEHTAAEVYKPTMSALRTFTRKPILITENGANPSSFKDDWIKSFFRWLPKHPDVVGFVWFEYSLAEGGSSDWRFTESPATIAAFRQGLKEVTLARAPT